MGRARARGNTIAYVDKKNYGQNNMIKDKAVKKVNMLKSISLLLYIYSFAVLTYLLLHGNIIANVKNNYDIDAYIDELHDGKQLTYDISSTKNNICEIHNLVMAKESIRIYYGLVVLNDTQREYFSLRREYFPNCNDAIEGGCIYSDIGYSVEYICDECNKERDKNKYLLEINSPADILKYGIKYEP